MNRVFYVVASSQFLSSLADNALLIASIALLVQMSEPSWFSPALKIFFVIPYVILRLSLVHSQTQDLRVRSCWFLISLKQVVAY